MIRYILKGLSHYIYLLLNMLDFKDNGFILIIILGMLVMCIKDKTIYKSCISVLKSIYNISKTKVGFLKYLKLYGWLICVIYLAINRRFYTESLDISYYWSIFILNIYFWCDLMKNRDIENQYDFVIYMFINIILIVMIACYFVGINNERLSEILFYIPIFILIHFKAYNKKFPNILKMPFFTENNFFGLDPSKYNKK